MKTLSFTYIINTSSSMVWSVLWNDTTYRQWTAAFSVGSFVETNWNEGSEARFLSPSGDGIYSTITKNVKNEALCIKHIGNVVNGINQAVDVNSQSWSGSEEKYFLSESNNKTTLTVEIDTIDEYVDYFESTFPKALNIVKALSEDTLKPAIIIFADVNATIEKVWNYWNQPEHITKWYSASDDWHAPHAENNLVDGGTFVTRMEAKDGSFGFDFSGKYISVIPNKYIEILLGDGRNIKVTFEDNGDKVRVIETFEPENENSHELQRFGWQSILNNFKKYVEA